MQDTEKIREQLESIRLWQPGVTAITDLGRFRDCVPSGAEGSKAEERFDAYAADFEQDMATASEKYSPKALLPPRNAGQYLDISKKEVRYFDEGKTQTSECSSFAYSAVSELMLNDEVRKKYDIIQAGTMYIDQGLGGGRQKFTYAHNVAVLIPKGASDMPKGTKVTEEVGLPPGSLIIDPWARALGNPADTSLAVSPENFEFRDTLYPLVVNYNTANEADLEATVTEFREDHPTLEQERHAAFVVSPIPLPPSPPSVEEIVAEVEEVQEQTSNWGFMFNALTTIASVSASAALVAGVAIGSSTISAAAVAVYATVNVASNFQNYKERFSNMLGTQKGEDYNNENEFDSTPRV